MSEFSLNCSITDKDFMIHILNNLPKDYDIILDRLKNHLTSSGDDVLTVICTKLNHQYEKLKVKMKKRKKKEKVLVVYHNQHRQWCHKCGKYCHSPDDNKCPQNKKDHKNDEKKRKMRIKRNILMITAIITVKGHRVEDCYIKNNKEKKNEKTEKAVDENNDDNFALCSLMLGYEKENVKKKVQFMENIKMPIEACVLCTIDGEIFHMLAIRDSGAS